MFTFALDNSNLNLRPSPDTSTHILSADLQGLQVPLSHSHSASDILAKQLNAAKCVRDQKRK